MEIPAFSLEGKIAIITGSSGGIGKPLSLGFAKAGALVVLAARKAAELEAIANEITSQGGKALAVPTDVTNSIQVSEMVQRAVKEFGWIDILVNGVGGGDMMPLLDISEEAWDEMLARNLKSVFLCCQAVGRVMIEQKSGSIINFGTGAATNPVPSGAHYAAAKAGVLHFTRCLASEWGRFNIRVNCISPGLVDDHLGRSSMGPLFEEYARRTALGRAGQPEDMIGIAIFLASDASAYISGAIVPVSGGPS
jgi:NAD(P)-dependent dehydrogenase (short-subunit alcohol dehydrogenase family)